MTLFTELQRRYMIKNGKENPQKLTQLIKDLIQDTSWEKGQHKETSP